MIGNIFSKYFNNKNSEVSVSHIKELEILTKKIIDSGNAPEYPIMQVMIELSENGVIGLDKDGAVAFFNSSSIRLLDNMDIKEKKIFTLFDEQSNKNLLAAIYGEKDKSTTKISITKDKVYDVLLYKVKNGKICYILFIINCLEDNLFKRQNCPLKNNCPFNHICQTALPKEAKI